MPTEQLRILFLDDSERDAAHALEVLTYGNGRIAHARVEDAESFARALDDPWDVVLGEWTLPRTNTREALALLRGSNRDVPYIVVSNVATSDACRQAAQAGARDYIFKDRLFTLAPGVTREVEGARARAATQAAIRTRDERYDRLLTTLSDGVVHLDAASHIVHVNDVLARMLGYSPRELVGRSVLDLIDEDSREATLRGMKEAAPGARTAGERKLVRKDASHFWTHVETMALFDEQERYAGRIAIIKDLSVQRRAEQARTASEERLQQLVDSGVVGIAVSDGKRLVEANDAFLAQVGFTRDDLDGGLLEWNELTPREWWPTNAILIAEARRDGKSSPREKEYYRKDGTRIPVLVAVTVIDDKRVMAITVDLTELHATRAQFRQAQKMEAIGRLAGGVAHDFNNMLSVILSYSAILLGDLAKDDPAKEDLEEIIAAGQRAADLTRQLLTFSRQQIVEPTFLDLTGIVRELAKMLRRVVGEDVRIDLGLASSLGTVHADRSQIEQAVMNLVVNARDAMPQGGALTITTENVDLDERFAASHHGVVPGRYVALSVTDTGTGIAAENLGRIFEPFFTTKEAGKGTGLGLATVFGAVQQSRGTVWVESTIGAGTTFRIYLPRVDAAPNEPSMTLPPVSLTGTETVLLVEDEETVRTVVRNILARRGYTVIETSDGEAALRAAREHREPIDLVLSDIVMPRMNGLDLVKRVAEIRPETRFLCMSGYLDDRVGREELAETGLPFLQKPITPAALARKVREVLDASDRQPRRGEPVS